MCKLPLVSVIIPAYNHESYIQETIKSIINQTYKNIELIILDDGSKDSTWQKIQEMREECNQRFVRICLNTKENEGTCKTLNKLLSMAKGDFIYLIASDDLAKPYAIEKEVQFLNRNPEYALCVGDNEIIDKNSKKCYWDRKQNIVYDKNKAKYLTFVDFLKRHNNFFNDECFGKYWTLYKNNYISNGYLVRKSIFDKKEYFTQEAPLEDYYLMLQISKRYKMKYLDEILFSYRWHAGNTVRQKEKMAKMTAKTRIYEEKLLHDISDENSVYPDVIKIKKFGLLYRTYGIPFIFQILYYRKGNNKTRIIKLFNFTIFKYSKNAKI